MGEMGPDPLLTRMTGWGPELEVDMKKKAIWVGLLLLGLLLAWWLFKRVLVIAFTVLLVVACVWLFVRVRRWRRQRRRQAARA